MAKRIYTQPRFFVILFIIVLASFTAKRKAQIYFDLSNFKFEEIDSVVLADSDSSAGKEVKPEVPPAVQGTFESPSIPGKLPSSGALNGSGPKSSFRDNLRKDLRYATAFLNSGFSNQVLEQFNLLHLMTVFREDPNKPQVIPILFPFTPDGFHLKTHKAPVLRFSDVFDLEALAKTLEMPIVESHELKEEKPCCYLDKHPWTAEEKKVEMEFWRGKDKVKDNLSCWSPMAVSLKHHDRPRNGLILRNIYNIETSWTPTPGYLIAKDRNVVFSYLAEFLFPPQKNDMLKDWLQYPYQLAQDMYNLWPDQPTSISAVFGKDYKGEGTWREPETSKDGDIMCFDALFWISERGDFPYSRESDDGPWHTVGRHARWTPQLLEMTRQTLASALDLPSDILLKNIPKFIAVHIRRTNTLDSCKRDKEREPCLQVKHYEKHVKSVRKELAEKGIKGDLPVLVTTDEVDPEYLATIKAAGWYFIDHKALQTVEKYGVWYPTLIDSVLLSMGTGIVGSEGSTQTLLAQRRSKAWNQVYAGGITSKSEAAKL